MPRVTITIPGKNAQPYRFALDRKKVAMGRGSENDIVIDCSSISVHHAVMERIEGGYQLRDLGSTNGTKYKGKPKEKIELVDGRSVQIGDVKLDFNLTAEEQVELAKERPDGEPPIIREEAEEAPPKKERPKPKPAPPAPVAPPSAAANFFMMLVFLALAAGAFFLGMSIRYSKDNPGRSMVADMKNGVPAEELQKPAPDAPEDAPGDE